MTRPHDTHDSPHDTHVPMTPMTSSYGEFLDTQFNDLSSTQNHLNGSKVNFDQILYMYDNNIYGSYVHIDTVYYYSYNIIDSNDFNVWEVKKESNNLLLMNSKFVIYDKNQFFDLIPNTNNKILY
ncbi:hypothetical protein [Sedimentibacter sp.]|uniref:hypothetical protein n=1 Tax=Sedimentibacter sp. TaxID=1960295 RepID=UPI0028ABF15F|nr:hypothetical protein [Sedimentibacter sp.]